MAGAFAYVDALGGGGDEREDFGGDEGVVEDDVGGLEEAHRFNGEEIGIAGASAYEEDSAGEVGGFGRRNPRRNFRNQGFGARRGNSRSLAARTRLGMTNWLPRIVTLFAEAVEGFAAG